MPTDGEIVAIERIEPLIQVFRSQKVLIDADLAALYGVTTRRLNEQVKRNRARFPGDFAFTLTAEEKAEVVANCDHLAKLKYSKTLPTAFTEHWRIELTVPEVIRRLTRHKVSEPTWLRDER